MRQRCWQSSWKRFPVSLFLWHFFPCTVLFSFFCSLLYFVLSSRCEYIIFFFFFNQFKWAKADAPMSVTSPFSAVFRYSIHAVAPEPSNFPTAPLWYEFSVSGGGGQKQCLSLVLCTRCIEGSSGEAKILFKRRIINISEEITHYESIVLKRNITGGLFRVSLRHHNFFAPEQFQLGVGVEVLVIFWNIKK